MNTQLEFKDDKTLRYEYIAYQINREDSLVNYRLTWVLTLNGFLFAALGFIGSKITADINIFSFFKWALPLTGILTSASGLLGVIASQNQISYLSKLYDKLDDSRWPRPFGSKEKPFSFHFGRMPSLVPLAILCIVWVGLLCSWY